ncbi:MAG TPA: hypothetical protein VGC34_18205, partial [Steroidobacteraceae bacterium]
MPGTSVTGAISTSGGLGVYSIGVSQLVNSAAAQQTMTVVPSVEFLGSISGTTLVVAPTGTLAIGQIISTATSSGPTLTTITTIGTSGSGGWTYAINPGVTPTTVAAMTAVPTAGAVKGYLSPLGPSMTLTTTSSTTLFGTFLPGQQITGPGISAPTYITGTSSVGGALAGRLSAPWSVGLGLFPIETFTTSAASGAIFTGSTSGASTTLTVASVSSGVLGVGHVLVGAAITTPLYISALGTGIGGAGTYILSASVSIPSSTMASIPAAASFIGTLSGATLIVPAMPPLPAGTTIVGSGIEANTYITNTSLINLYPVNTSQSAGSPISPITMTAIGSTSSKTLASNTFTTTGYISGAAGTLAGNTLSASSVQAGSTLAIGQQLIGFGIPQGTSITSTPVVSGGTTTCLLAFPQQLSIGPMTALTATGASALCSISGTTFTLTVLSGTLANGQLLVGPGIPVGTSITNLAGSAPTFTGTLAVPQYLPSTTAIYEAGSVVVGSIYSSPGVGTSLGVSAGTLTGTAVGQLLGGSGIAPGTNIVSGTSSPYLLASPQPTTATEALSLFTPFPATSIVGGSSVLTLDFAEARPGRLIEVNSAPGTILNEIQSFGASTVVRVINSDRVKITTIQYDSNPPDTNSTVLDLQGAST